jgi:AcrR family transcriptional regulator
LEDADLAGIESPLARDRVREARRLALIEAAEPVFAERGFAGATMAEIASRAGYSAGNLYNVFDGKEALFRAVVRARGELLLARLREALGRADGLTAKLDAFVEALISFVEEHRSFFGIYLRRTSGIGWTTERLDEDALEMQSVVEQEVTRTLRKAMARGEIAREDPELHTCVLLGTLQRYVTRWSQQGESAQDLRQGVQPLRRILARALGVK